MSDERSDVPITGGGTQRLEALADGVFAIVMTLLVFEITPSKEPKSTHLGETLLALWPSFVAFVVSVGLVGIYWSAHRSMFQLFRRTSHELNWLNLLFLAVVSLVPFSTRLIAGYHADPIALAVYGTNLALIGLSLLVLWLHATGRRRLVDPDMSPDVVRYGVSRCVVGTCGYGLATVLAFVNTSLALIVFAGVPLLYILSAIQRPWLAIFGLAPPLDRPK